jgi:hypothetical protein
MNLMKSAHAHTTRIKRPCHCRLFLEALEDRMLPSTFTVFNTNDDGAGSLRQAIVEANSHPGLDRITFAIPGPGVHTIQPLTTLPAVTDPVIIDGTRQPGYAGTPLIELDGSQCEGDDGLTLLGAGSTVRGLVINDFPEFGIHIEGDNNVIEANFLGTDPTGTVARGNGNGVLVHGRANRIGGNDAERRNLISGNNLADVLFAGDSNVLSGNWIGTDVTGSAVLSSLVGVVVSGQSNRIGGEAEGEGDGDPHPSNVISGCATGISINGNDNVVAGDYVGTDKTGEAGLGNGMGVLVMGMGNCIGTSPGDRDADEGNLISGNSADGVDLAGDQNVVAGNRIGTDRAGRKPVGNGVGIYVGGMSNTIGTADQGNLVSGNQIAGIVLAASANSVAANWIGTDRTGMTAVGNGQIGVWVLSGSANQIGSAGTTASAGNVISGNGEGIRLGGNGTLVVGNLIGTDATGCGPLANGSGGPAAPSTRTVLVRQLSTGILVVPVVVSVGGNQEVRLQLRTFVFTTFRAVSQTQIPPSLRPVGSGITIQSSGNQIGGPGELGNTIAFNEGAGVEVDSGVRNRIQGNAIHANRALGIDLGADGVTFNDPGDADAGANNLQNFPTLLRLDGGTSTRVAGTLNSQPGQTFTLDFYASADADPSGFGQGRRYLGSATVTTDAAGDADFDVMLQAPTRPGDAITSTATDPLGNTSEFSFALTANRGALVQVENGRLVIRDHDSNVRLAAVPSGAGSFLVTAGNQTQTVHGVSHGIFIDLDGDHPAVFLDGSLTPLTVPGGIAIDADEGAGVSMVGVTTEGPVVFDLHGGRGLVNISSATFGGDLTMRLGMGNAEIFVQNSAVQGKLDLQTAAGQELVVLENLTVNGPVAIATGDGPDVVIVTGLVAGGPASIATGTGDDRVYLVSSSIRGLLRLDGGAGYDSLVMAEVTALAIDIEGFENVQTL